MVAFAIGGVGLAFAAGCTFVPGVAALVRLGTGGRLLVCPFPAAFASTTLAFAFGAGAFLAAGLHEDVGVALAAFAIGVSAFGIGFPLGVALLPGVYV